MSRIIKDFTSRRSSTHSHILSRPRRMSFTANQHKPAILSSLQSPVYAMLHEAKGKKGLSFEQVREKW